MVKRNTQAGGTNAEDIDNLDKTDVSSLVYYNIAKYQLLFNNSTCITEIRLFQCVD